MSDWQNRRPIFDALPEKGYQDNTVADALTFWIDSKLSDKADQLQNFYKTLDPDTCPESMLEYLAFLHGLSGSFWDNAWSSATKRTFIKNSHSLLWRYRGTSKVIAFVLSTHGLKYSIWTDGDLRMPFKLSQKFATSKLRFFIRLSYTYARDGWEWKEAKRTAKNFAPAIVGYSVCHEVFRLGFSRLGEPMFKNGI